MTLAAITVRDLSKTFKTVLRTGGKLRAIHSLVAPRHQTRTVVADLSFEVGTGEMLAFLGPNGAGKSTTIKILTGILTPTSGDVLVNGFTPYRDRQAAARGIAAVFGHKTQLWWDLPARESFSLIRDIYQISAQDYTSRLTQFEETLELSSFWDMPVHALSLGQRVRCDLAAAFLPNPKVVLLDEPTLGMDAVVKERTRAFLRSQVRDRGHTMILTTHDMLEVDDLCSRTLIINHGRMVFDGPIQTLKDAHARAPRINFSFAYPVESPDPPGAEILERGPAYLLVRPLRGTSPERIVGWVVARFPVILAKVEEISLDEVMRDAYLAAPIGSENSRDTFGPSE